MRTGRIFILILICGLDLQSQTNILVDKKDTRYLYRSGDNYFEYRPKSATDTSKNYVFEKNYIDKNELKWIKINSYKDIDLKDQKLDNPEIEPVIFEFYEITNQTKTGFTIRLRYWTEYKDSPIIYHYYCIDIKTVTKNWQTKKHYCGTEM